MSSGARGVIARRAVGSAFVASILAFAGCAPYTPSTANYPSDWNRDRIAWQPYALGLRAAAREHKPILLVFYTDWCPHCHNYSRVFHDPRVVEASRAFVMIRIDRDGDPELSQAYVVDGDYVPRTFFLLPSGDLMKQLHAARSDFRYFLDEYEPDELLDLMQQARELAARSR
ncbi:MAG TPA: thioredoxin family protein [Polyangiaceae bacterium]|nr:thioredoxin family protein [Polyangiaceae bacterium]